MLDPNKNSWIYLFVCAFGLVIVYAYWPYIIAAIIPYAIAKGFCTPRSDHDNHRRCPRWEAQVVILLPHGVPDLNSGGSWVARGNCAEGSWTGSTWMVKS